MWTSDIFARVRRKVRQIAQSDLIFTGKIAYVADAALGFFRSTRAGYREYRLTGGASVVLRENSTDRKVFDEVFLEKIYYAPPGQTQARQEDARYRNDGPILIDLGANIGLSAIALARQLQPKGIIAVEPDAANFALLRENLQRAGLSNRAKTIRAFAGSGRGFAELIDSGNGAWGMRMGAPTRSGVPVWPMEDIVALAEELFSDTQNRFGDPPPIVLKCDIEGAEAQLFQTLPRWEHFVSRIILELHTEFLSAESLRACLDASRYSWHIEGEVEPDALLAVLTLERRKLKLIPQTQHAAVS